MMTRTFATALVSFACLVAGASGAHAQMEEDLIPSERNFISPEQLILELRIGPYNPDEPTGAFDNTLGDDDGPLFELELDVIAYRLDEILYLTGGASIGYASFSDNAIIAADQTRASEETDLDVIPLSLLASLRIDVLPRKLGIPLIFTGKLGYTWAHWSTSTGGVDEGSGVSVGLRWAAQAAIDLDTFEPRAARAMDEEWGINHSFAFFELWGFEPSETSLELGGTNWVAGLGFVL